MSELKAINSVFNIEIEKIDPNPDQPRKHFSQESLNDLAESIRRYGVMQPITVVRRESQTSDGGITTRYEIIAGERRWRASIVAGMASIPAIVRQEEETEQERFELSILENLQREDLNPVDKARSFARLADEFDMKHAEIADKLGKSREYVTNALRLLVLPENVLDGLSNGEISEGHTRPLLTLKDRPDELQVLFNEIKTKSLTVRDAEKTARELSGGKKTARYNSNQNLLDPEMESLQTELAKSLGTTVSIDKKEKGGKLTIDFFSRDDLKKLLSMVGAAGMADMVAQKNIEQHDQSTIETQEPIVSTDMNTITDNTVNSPESDSATQVQDSAPVILNEEIILKEDRDIVDEPAVEDKPDIQVVNSGINSTDFVREDTAIEPKNADAFADKEFTITPQVRDIQLDESLADKNIVTQSAHTTQSIDRGIGNNPLIQDQVAQSNRAQEIQAEIDALAGNISDNDIEPDYARSSNEPKHIDLGDMELHEPEFSKPNPAPINTENTQTPTALGGISMNSFRSEGGNVIDPVFTAGDSFVPEKNTESEENTDVSVAGDDFVPKPVTDPVATTINQSFVDQVSAPVNTTSAAIGESDDAVQPAGPGVTEQYPQGDPYRLDNFSV